ncbi:MAG: hypothetical protein ACT4NX_01790 [Deltaproteobacteria bacterium]
MATLVFTLLVSVNLALYAVEPYAPSVSGSAAYSIATCPSHTGGSSTARFIELLIQDGDEGARKQCYCTAFGISRLFIAPAGILKPFPPAFGNERPLSSSEIIVASSGNSPVPSRSPPL